MMNVARQPVHVRLAAGVLAIVGGLAVVGVSTAEAAEEGPVISTTCGAGTLTECGTKAIETCDIEFSVTLDPTDKNFGITFKRTNCRSTGTVTLYKDMTQNSSLSGSCNLLLPLLGMPSGSGCSE